MRIVYALSDKGARECAAAHSTLPVELHGLLRIVDGRRTREDLLAATGKSALTAGGLRWLSASGYIQPSEMADLDTRPAPATAPFAPSAPAHSAPSPLSRRPDDVCHAMSNFMIRSIRRHLGRYAYEQQIATATTLGELLPYLHPLIDAIVARAGTEAGAEFADTAAFLLQPPRRAERR